SANLARRSTNQTIRWLPARVSFWTEETRENIAPKCHRPSRDHVSGGLRSLSECPSPSFLTWGSPSHLITDREPSTAHSKRRSQSLSRESAVSGRNFTDQVQRKRGVADTMSETMGIP